MEGWMGMMLMMILMQDDPLQNVAWLSGEWRGKAKYGTQEVETRFVYAKTLNGKFLQWTYQALVDGKAAFESQGYLGWEAEEKRYVEFGFGVDGSIGWGRGPWKDGALTLEGRVTGFGETRKTLRREGVGKYTETVEAKKDGAWVVVLQAEYTRAK
jgi:hypothetical protein